MSRFNPAHARLFGGVQAPDVQRREKLCRSFDVELVRVNLDEGRARFALDDAARLELHPVIDDKLQCGLVWADGAIECSVTVYAVHPGGFVDVRGYAAICEDRPARTWLRRWPNERNREMASEQAEKIESARRVYAAALGTKDEAAAKIELEKAVEAARRTGAKAVR